MYLIGTYVRTSAIDNLVVRFLGVELNQRKQIISLGAGSDTRFFRLSADPEKRHQLVYHELDFASNTSQKIAFIKRSPSLMSLIEGSTVADEANAAVISEEGDSLFSSTYNIHALDLRSLPITSTPLRNVDTSLPTLLISECCLIYLPPTDADSILRYFTSTLFPPTSPLGIVVYEPINPDDAFGRVMVQNLATRGIVLQTLKKYGSLDRQKARLKMLGFGNRQEAVDVESVWEDWVDEKEKERIARLEMVDEVEEWRMLAQHYCVAFAWRDGVATGISGGTVDEQGRTSDAVFSAWHDLIISSTNVGG